MHLLLVLVLLGTQGGTAEAVQTGSSDAVATAYESSHTRYRLRSEGRGDVVLKSHLLSLQLEASSKCHRSALEAWISQIRRSVADLKEKGRKSPEATRSVFGRGRWIRLDHERLWISTDEPTSRSALLALDGVPADFHVLSVRFRQACKGEAEVAL